MEVGDNNVIVVAHPDDECLFASALPLTFPYRRWTIICCSVPRHDPVRAWKFFDACEVLDAYPKLIPSTETDPRQPLLRLELLNLEHYDLIVTHNSEGEYGHLHHKCVHEHIIKNYSHKRILTFGYKKNSLGSIRFDLNKMTSWKKSLALEQYNHLHPYNGKSIPKYEALRHRYYTVEGIDPNVETYDETSTGLPAI